MTPEQKAVYDSLGKLRRDANERGMGDLGWIYFESQTRLLWEDVNKALKRAN